MMFTIEFVRVRDEDGAHATLDRLTHVATDLDDVKARAKALFSTLDLPQKPDAVRITDQAGEEVFFWRPEAPSA